jgi:TonB family protein
MIVAVVAMLLVGGDVAAPSTPQVAGTQQHHPRWVRGPSNEDVLAVYPAAARTKGISGRAEMRCEVKPDGTLAACVVISEEPKGRGFGEAVLKLAPTFQMTDPGGIRPGAKVQIPARWSH